MTPHHKPHVFFFRLQFPSPVRRISPFSSGGAKAEPRKEETMQRQKPEKKNVPSLAGITELLPVIVLNRVTGLRAVEASFVSRN